MASSNDAFAPSASYAQMNSFGTITLDTTVSAVSIFVFVFMILKGFVLVVGIIGLIGIMNLIGIWQILMLAILLVGLLLITEIPERQTVRFRPVSVH